MSDNSNRPQPGERIFYIRDANRNPVGVMAYSLLRGNEDDTITGVYIGASFLHPNDNFDKLRGRQIALGRLRHTPDFAFVVGTSAITAALLQLIKSTSTPHRIKRILLRGY